MIEIPTTDFDAGPAPLVVGDVTHLARVLIDGRRWAMMPPGDMIAAFLLGIDGEGARHGPQ